MRKLRTILQSRYLFKIIAFFSCIISLLYTNFIHFQSKYFGDETYFVGRVISYKIDGDKLTITLKAKEKLIVNYYFISYEEKVYYYNNLKLGDVINVWGILTKPNKSVVFGQFNYQRYLYERSIFYLLGASKIKIYKHNTNVFYFIKNMIISRLNKIDDTGYIRTFILGDKSYLDVDMIDMYQKNGISHLFSISGMHVSFIVGVLLFFLNRVTYCNFYKYGIISTILIFYLFLTGGSASILRVVIIFILSSINQYFNFKIKNVDLMLGGLSIISFINPFILYDVGFQFSYVISFFLVVFRRNIKNKFKQSLYSSFLCVLVSIPICLMNFYEVNLFSFFLNLIMIPLVSIIVFPFSLLVFVFPALKPVYSVVISVLEYINVFSGNIKLFCFQVKKPSFLFVIFLYSIIIFSFRNWRFLIFLVIVLLFFKYLPYVVSDVSVTVIDVGQGDSILLVLPNKQKTVLIDTGGKIGIPRREWQIRKREFSYVVSITIPYLKYNGIEKIDYLVLTHGDYDHMGEAINLVNNFKVEKVVFNCGPYNDLEKDLIKLLEKKKIEYYTCIKELNIDKNKLYFLQTKEYDNENDNSNVIYTELNNYKFMFMGDASITTEKGIMNKYNLPEIDVLKVGHHGSRTSSGEDFIDEINPKYSIISVGKNNRYGHPNKEVLDNLNNSKIYRTDQDGSIMFKIKNNKLKIETCSP